jgi:hypothetical protein
MVLLPTLYLQLHTIGHSSNSSSILEMLGGNGSLLLSSNNNITSFSSNISNLFFSKMGLLVNTIMLGSPLMLSLDRMALLST